jgi:hypothetical protein
MKPRFSVLHTHLSPFCSLETRSQQLYVDWILSLFPLRLWMSFAASGTLPLADDEIEGSRKLVYVTAPAVLWKCERDSRMSSLPASSLSAPRY